MRPTRGAGPRRLAPVAHLAHLACVAAVAVVAVFSLVAAPVPMRSADTSPIDRAHLERRSVEAVPILNRRPAVPWEIAVPATAVLVVAHALIGLVAVVLLTRVAWAPGLLPVQRGPPSSR